MPVNIPFVLWGYVSYPGQTSYVRLYDGNTLYITFNVVSIGSRIGYVINIANLDNQWDANHSYILKEYDSNNNELCSRVIVLSNSPYKIPFEVVTLDVINKDSLYVPDISVSFTASPEIPYEIIVSEDKGFSGYAWKLYNQVTSFKLLSKEGTHNVYAKVRDNTGVESIVSTIAVQLKDAAPANPSIVIKEGTIIQSLDINLKLGVDFPFEMIVSSNSSFVEAVWVPFQSDMPFIVEPGIGLKIVYAKFRNVFLKESSVVFAKTFLASDVNSPSKPELVGPINVHEGSLTYTPIVSNMPVMEFKNKIEDGILKYRIELSIDNFTPIEEPYYRESMYAVFDQVTGENYFTRQFTSEPWKPRLGDWTWNDDWSRLAYLPSHSKNIIKSGPVLSYDDFADVNVAMGEAIQTDDHTQVKSFYTGMYLDDFDYGNLAQELKIIDAWLASFVNPRILDDIIRWNKLNDIYRMWVEKSITYTEDYRLNVAFVIYINNLSEYTTEDGFNKAVEILNKLITLFEKYGLKICIYTEKSFADGCALFSNNYLLYLNNKEHEIGTNITLPSNLINAKEQINYVIVRKNAIDKLGVQDNVGITGGWEIDNWVELYPSMQFKWAFNYKIPNDYRFKDDEWWISRNGYPGGAVCQFKVPFIMELPPQSYQWRIRAFNGFGWSSNSDIGNFNVGQYTDRTVDWSFEVKQDRVKVYWTDGVVTTEKNILFIKGEVDISPADYPITIGSKTYSSRVDGEWWMFVKKNTLSNYLTLHTGCIGFCDKYEFPYIIVASDEWIPVLYFQDGVRARTPAIGSNFVSVVADNLPINDYVNYQDKFLRDHANDEKIHGADVEILNLPQHITKTVFVTSTIKYLMTLIAIANSGKRTAGVKAQGWGIGLIGVDSIVDISDVDLAGTGAFAKGNNYDVCLKNGTLTSVNGQIKFGKKNRPTKLKVISRDRPGLIV